MNGSDALLRLHLNAAQFGSFQKGTSNRPTIPWDNGYAFDPTASATSKDYWNWVRYGSLNLGARLLLPDASRAYSRYRDDSGNDLAVDYNKAYCTTNWCIRNPTDSIFAYSGNEAFSGISGCDETYSADIELAVGNASQEIADFCGTNNLVCLVDGVCGNLPDALAAVSDQEPVERAQEDSDPSPSSSPSTSGAPSFLPTATIEPSVLPSAVPTSKPSVSPSAVPSIVPSELPTGRRGGKKGKKRKTRF